MKKLLTLLLLVMSLLAFGQSNSQSIEVEIKYWKSIAESNDTAAYREYLQRYGEDGLYKDEALARIALLKNSGKQAQSQSMECCFYSRYTGAVNIKYVIRFDAEQSKVWLKPINYDTVRSNVAGSRDFYENQAVLTMSRESSDYHFCLNTAIGYNRYIEIFGRTPQLSDFLSYYDGWYQIRDWDKRFLREQWKSYQANLQLLSPDYYKNAWTTDEEYEYDPMKSTSARDVFFKRDKLHQIDFEHEDFIDGRYRTTKKEQIYVYLDDMLHRFYVRDCFSDYKKSCCMGYDYYYLRKTMQGYRYVAISKDKSSFIMWFEEDENLDGVIREKREYKRVPKEELLPKAVNYDFLNK